MDNIQERIREMRNDLHQETGHKDSLGFSPIHKYWNSMNWGRNYLISYLLIEELQRYFTRIELGRPEITQIF